MSNINLPPSTPSVGNVRGTAPLSAPQTPTTAQAPGRAAEAPGRAASGGAPVHMAAEEMEKHIDQALESSPVLNDEEAPLIDLEHLDSPPDLEEDDTEVPEGEAEVEEFEAISLETPDEAEESDDKDSEGEGGGAEAADSYLAAELRRYQQDRETPARRHAHLVKNAQGEDRPREAAAAVACESALGGLARPQQGSAGAFVGLSGAYTGKSFGVLGLANPAQLQPFVQALRKALARPDLDYLLLDLEKLPAQHQGYVLKTLPAAGAKPQQVLIWLAGGKVQWS